MHRLLRRQIEQHLGREGPPAPDLVRLLRAIDEEYRRADDDRTALQRALELVGDLTRRLPRVGAGAASAGPLPRLVRRAFESAPFAAVICDPGLEVLAWNRSAEQLFGHTQGDAVGHEVVDLLFAGDDRPSARRELRSALDRGEVEQSLRVATTRAGMARLDDWTIVPLRRASGRLDGAALFVREPFASDDRYAVAALGTGDVVFDWDLRADRLWLSDAWTALVGEEAAGGAPVDWVERVHPADRDAFMAALRACRDGEVQALAVEHRVRSGSSAWRWVLARGRTTRDASGKPVRLAGSIMDVTERRAASERALNDALHDPLTRFPNRALFLDVVRRTFARKRRREGSSFAVMFLDLDHFKAVNDGFGHAAGDELLVQFAGRLQGCLREGDTLARHGGDEFTILLDDVSTPAEVDVVAVRIQQATAPAYAISGHEVLATASIGAALWAPTYGRPEELLLDADTAMYRAKALGRARTVIFDPSTRERSPQLLDLEADLRRAILRDEFRIQYLPVVDVVTGRIQGLEALIRWAHPKRGLVSPGDFVPFAEETGLIVPIGSWLLRQAGRDFQGCRRAASGGRLKLHVNLSAKQLLPGALVDDFDGLLHEAQLDPCDLALEVTEASLEKNLEARAGLAELRGRGVQVCMDDFGSGHASLSALHRYELDALKIDRSLLAGGSPRGACPELVRTIVSLARDLGKSVVAEGVETAEQLYFLRELGCGAAQGFYFSPPVDRSVACTLLESAPTW
jgi:diguanylate cyclase (GGDEF)-like protein/PAS domain S-box-containing protein